MIQRNKFVWLLVGCWLGFVPVAQAGHTELLAGFLSVVPEGSDELSAALERVDYASAQMRLGWMYDTGHGVPQDNEEAVKWYHK